MFYNVNSGSRSQQYSHYVLQHNRKSNKSRGKLKFSKIINEHLLSVDIESYIMAKNGYPHCLIQLSDKQHSDLKDNSIHVSSISLVNNKLEYSTINYIGSNLRLKGKEYNIDDKVVEMQQVNLEKYKKRVFCITTTVLLLLPRPPVPAFRCRDARILTDPARHVLNIFGYFSI